MAFHQPTRQSLQRIVRPTSSDRDVAQHTDQPPQPQVQAAPDESQTWVLFSPATDGTTSASYLSSAGESVPTPGRSRFSDLGSLHTVARSHLETDSRQSAAFLSTAIDEESVEDDAELDSLDSHLPEFRTASSTYNQPPLPAAVQHHTTPVLPAHDGLGSFRLDAPAQPEVQEQIYAFEQFNPRRLRRRRESIELAELEIQEEREQQAHKIQRIEAWRLEQSRILLDEIHKETKRRRLSLSRPAARHHDEARDELVGDSSTHTVRPDDDPESMEWHEEPSPQAPEEPGLFASITRKVIRDIIGVDERLLSLLLGESLPEDDDLSSTPRADAPGARPSTPPPPPPTAEQSEQSSWQLQMLNHVAKELGDLINHLSPPHPGAFSTYARMQQMPIPYAGLPVIPETATAAATPRPMSRGSQEASVIVPEFKPTVPSQANPINIPHRPSTLNSHRDESSSDAAGPATFTQEEWERELDVKLVFRYLRSRFTSRTASAPSFLSGTSHLATCSTQESAAKAARVRQHHPLVARTRPPAERRTFKATAPPSPSAMRHAHAHASSCASQSTRRSARRSSVSSRHYWDIGGSLGTGSMIASVGPMGSWGEV